MRRAFGKAIVELAKQDESIRLLTGDVVQEMDEFRELFPDRFMNLGICEQTITGIAAGMAMEGLKPIIYSWTPFVLERPFEQVKMDIDEHNLPVILVGNSDYPTHGPSHRALDARGLVALFKNIRGFFPHDLQSAKKAILDAYIMQCPAVICLQNDRLPFL